MDLFLSNEDSIEDKPLAEQMRPQSFADFVGQKHLFGDRSVFRKMLDKGLLSNILLWGPPGTGKTTFALLLSQKFDSEFIKVNAIETGAKKLREIGNQAQLDKRVRQKSTILFIDEIHRLNKSQQDVLLPFTEQGDFTLVGATTENPSYEVNSALLSRVKVLLFKPLNDADILSLLQKVLEKKQITKASLLSEECLQQLIQMASGDARKFLLLIEPLLQAYSETDDMNIDWPLSLENYNEQFLSHSALYYDKSSDHHYDTISAFIKSIRGSDPDAALYYLARMVKGGEDPVFIARRLVILASEDVGNADPKALPLATSGLEAVKAIGLPEAGINLAQVTTYLASAPKSNRSYKGYKEALKFVEKTGQLPVPMALRSAQTQFVKKLGYGKDYKYSHTGQKGWVKQRFLPEGIADVTFYEPSDRGFEKNIKAYLEWMKS